MPEPTQTTPVLDPAAHNEEVKRKLESQDAAGHSTALTEADLKNSSDALDKLAESIGKEKEETPPTPTPEVKPEDAAKVAEAAKAAEEAAKQSEADLARAEEYFKDAPKLPPNVSPKTNDSFRHIKIKAAQEISAREAELEKIRKEKAELEEKLKNPVPAELDAEIKNLREWKAKLDVEADPKFKEFEKTINGTREFIYSQLTNHPGVSDKLVDAIKAHGGPDMIKWDKIWEGLKDPTFQRIIESKLADIEMAKFNKTEAVKSAKTNIQQYLGERAKQFENTTKVHTESTQKHLGEYLSKFAWMQEHKIADGTEEAKKKSMEEHNVFVNETRKSLMDALNDDTPEMRALMIAGMGQLLYLQRVHSATAAELKAAQTQLKEANDTITKIKSSSVSRMRESGAPTNATTPVKTDDAKLFNTPATQALDDLMKNMIEQRAKTSAMS